MADVNFDDAFIAFCATYDRLRIPNVKGGICNIAAYYPGPTTSPSEHIIVSASIKEVLDMISDEFMGFPILKKLVK